MARVVIGWSQVRNTAVEPAGKLCTRGSAESLSCVQIMRSSMDRSGFLFLLYITGSIDRSPCFRCEINPIRRVSRLEGISRDGRSFAYHAKIRQCRAAPTVQTGPCAESEIQCSSVGPFLLFRPLLHSSSSLLSSPCLVLSALSSLKRSVVRSFPFSDPFICHSALACSRSSPPSCSLSLNLAL